MTRHANALNFFVALLLIAMLSFPSVTHALRSTKQESFTDPDYIGYQPKTIVLMANFENLEMRDVVIERLTKDLQKKGLTVFRFEKLFPPTREWGPDERGEVYEKLSIEAVLVISEGASDQVVQAYGSQTWGSATATGFGNSATAYGNSTTTNLYSAHSNASFSGVLFDVGKNRVAWTSDVYTKASGTLIVGAKGDAKAAAKGVIEGLIENSHIPKKAAK